MLFLLYTQIRSFDSKAWEEMSIQSPLSLILAIILVFPNIWFAYAKWRVVITTIDLETDRSSRVQSFFAGLVTGMLTPNMVGNFLGRLYYFDKKYRASITGLTLLSNYAQFLVSITFGLVAIIAAGSFYPIDNINMVIMILSAAVVVSYILYFYVEYLFKWIPRVDLEDLRKVMRKKVTFRIQLWLLSAARFIVSTSQFMLMLHAFGTEVSFELLLMIWQVYLITMIAPSLLLGKIGVKESISLFVLTSIGVNEYAILITSLLIWFVNSLSPALLGLIVCKKKTA